MVVRLRRDALQSRAAAKASGGASMSAPRPAPGSSSPILEPTSAVSHDHHWPKAVREHRHRGNPHGVSKLRPPLFQQPALMFAVKGFEQASAFWISPGAVILDGVHGRG